MDGPAPDAQPVADAPAKRRRLPLAVAVVVPALLGAGLALSRPDAVGRLLGSSPSEAADTVETTEPVEYGVFSEIQGLIVNPAGSDGLRYLMVNVGFESESAKTLETLTAKEVAVRDAILNILGEKTVPQLADIAFRETLKAEIRDTVNVILGDEQIDRLYFTQYVLQ